MIDSKMPINAIDFEANRKSDKKANLNKNFPSEVNNPSEFSKREEVWFYINIAIVLKNQITKLWLIKQIYIIKS